MAYTNPIEQLDQEVKELEAKITSTPLETATTGTEATTQEKKENVAPEATEQVTQEQKPTTTTETVEDWEKRYKNLRASRDENLYKTKSQLAAALETIGTLQAQIAKLQAAQPKVDPLAGVFTQEDAETLGEATVEALRKATRKATESATAPLQAELEEERKRRAEMDKRLAEQTKRDAYDIFLRRISTAVPNWEAINFDPEFEKFMNEPDYDGTLRKDYFLQAEAQGNAALVIRYMKEFEGTVPKKDKLASKVTPVGGETAGNTTEQKQEVISRDYINKFYDDLSKGRYRGRASEADAIEARIDKAVMEGRVVA